MRVTGNLCYSDKVARVSWCNKRVSVNINQQAERLKTSNVRWCENLYVSLTVCAGSCFFITQLKNISAMKTWNSSASLSAAEIWISDVLLCLKLGLWHSRKSHMHIFLLQIQNINVEITIIVGNLQLICILFTTKISNYLIQISAFITSTINISN